MSLKKLIKEELSSYVEDGTVTLYHYSDISKDELVLDVNMFGKNSWTKREQASSATPKLFFYLDPDDKERFFNSGKALYSVDVPVSDIYDILEDTLNLKDTLRQENNGALDIDELIKQIKQSGYKGMYYKPKLELVTWFENIKVFPVTTDTDQNSNEIKNIESDKVLTILKNNFICIISAERSFQTPIEKKQSSQQLKNDLKSLPYYFTKAWGGYVETVNGEKVSTEEESYLVWYDGDKDDSFLNDMMELGSKYGQETILYKSPYKMKGYLIGTINSEYLKKGQRDDVGKLNVNPSEDTQFFTRIGNLKFSFT